MTNPIVNIENVSCGYVGKVPFKVRVDSFVMQRSKLIFLVGKSGSGKSTFLEALGLMNNTLLSEKDDIEMNFGTKYSIQDLWKDNVQLSKVRSQYLSFIFQETNLMSNFTLGENMAFGLLLGGKPLEDVKDLLYPVMDAISLDRATYNRPITEVSGGQRQRAAFVRAISADFEIIFGDEPTGNLDENTAYNLMKTLKGKITSANCSGLIVTHDIDLACDFGDVIYYVEPVRSDVGDTVGGTISDLHSLVRDNDIWRHNSNDIVDPKSFIKNKIK